jgi:hypothetical protein
MAEQKVRRFHSEAQRTKCRSLVASGHMSQADFDRMERATPSGQKLPERVKREQEK